MKVKCVKISNHYSNFITINKIYNIISIINRNNRNNYYICCDNNTNIWLPDNLFIPMREYRKNILRTIIDDKYY